MRRSGARQQSLTRFVGNDPYSEHLPDDTTLSKVRRSQVKLQLGEKVFANVDQVLQASGLPEGSR